MRKILLFNVLCFVINNVFGQISLDDRVNIYDFDSLSVNIIYDDFDNDGDLDIMKFSGTDSFNVLLQKNNNGDFNLNQPILVSSGVRPIVSLDLDNDGFLDLLTYHSFTTIGVLYNQQDNTFSEEVTVQTFNGSYDIHPMKFDYNNDGFMDLIAIDDSEDAYVLINNQMGGLEPPQFLVSVGTFDFLYDLDDFDNDGDFDFYIRDGDKLIININGSGVFDQPGSQQTQSSLRSFEILDIDGNGYKDVLYWKNDAIWAKYYGYNATTTRFIVINDVMVVNNIPKFSNYVNARSIHIEDQDNGSHDVYVTLATIENQLDMHKFNIQNNVFSNAQIVLSDFQVNVFGVDEFSFLDLNNDDNLDFSFVSNFNQNKFIFINNNINDTPDKTICIQQAVKPNDFYVIDMNGDGENDICVGTQNGLGYFEKTASNELSGLRSLIGVSTNPNASAYTHINITDINNDGLGDVIDYTGFDNEAKIFKNLGDDNFEFVQSVSMTGIFNGTHLSFADIDGDDFKDLVIFDQPNFYWAKNNNGLSFQSLQQLVVNNVDNDDPLSIMYEDFNDDDEIDILVLRYFYESGQFHTEVNLLENDNGEFTGNIIADFNGNYGRSHLKIDDFDQDNDLDFFVHSTRLDQPLLFFKNDGSNNFISTTIDNIDIEDIEFYDGDGDGYNEIYAWNYESFANHIFYYDTTDYINFTKIPIDSYSASYDNLDDYTRGDLFMYDYNNDGKDDLFINNYSSFQALISVYENTSESLGVEEIDNNSLSQMRLYPNPFVNSVKWTKRGNETYSLQLYSQDGKLIFEKVISENNMDFSSYDSGVYFLSISEVISGNKKTFKIIKN
ncbi:T9SS type A sorting domain-containing protein [Winogradskyella sp. PG-2]|uniref:T9SS type A sorting domain-containing protein n=1 Tax=Winogradskyella sp. PG-2 TaxID=754409 RepID=UPI00045875FC|nr:T9SS type A sorting domain-containing protein [Winogradskyella sp. PG-2]BAO77611.1 hypothetical protein WPG_3381 [Winogradskyella sp. PG-2]